MMCILCSKASLFWGNEPSLYPRDILGILVKLIFFRSDLFLNNQNHFVFTWIIWTGDMTIDNKTMYLILKSLQQGLINISLCLQYNVFILNICIWLLRSWISSWCSFCILVMASWWFPSILSVSWCRICRNNRLQQLFLKSFDFQYWLENNSSVIPFWLM